MLGNRASREAIDKAEDRELFDKTMKGIGIETPRSGIAHSMEEALIVQEDLSFLVLSALHLHDGSGGGVPTIFKNSKKFVKRTRSPQQQSY